MNERPIITAGAAKILSLAEETKFAANGIVSRTVLRTENSRTVLFGFSEGQELTEHTSTQHALIQILSGRCEFSLAGVPNKLKAGDILLLPGNPRHVMHDGSGAAPLLARNRASLNFTISENLGSDQRLDLLCGHFAIAPPHDRLLRSYLPPRLVVHAEIGRAHV